MIDPFDLSTIKSTADRQEFLLFCLFVQSKPVVLTARKVDQFLKWRCTDLLTPFGHVARLIRSGYLQEALSYAKLGQYKRNAMALDQLIKLNVDTCSLYELEKIHGIGPKTSRFFLMYGREITNGIAILDTHVLSWMRENGYPDCPKSTPSGKRYTYWEGLFISEACKRGMYASELDKEIWRARAIAV